MKTKYNINSRFERLLDLCKKAELVNVRGLKKIREGLPWYKPVTIGINIGRNSIEAFINVEGKIVKSFVLTAENAINIVKPAGRDIHVGLIDYNSSGMLNLQNVLTFRWK